jgi:hypothetical protein
MNLKVYKEGLSEEGVYLKMFEQHNCPNCIRVVAVDKNGEFLSSILSIYQDGISRGMNVDPKLEFDLDEEGQLLIE